VDRRCYGTAMSTRVAGHKRAARHGWTVTPVQAVLGRRFGLRYQWKYWAGGMASAWAAGLVWGIKIGRRPQDSRKDR
jgi:hypothetical protein